MKIINKGTFTIIATKSDRGQFIIIDEHGRIFFDCGGCSYVETGIGELTELIAMAIKFRAEKHGKTKDNRCKAST